jgi:flagellar basal-body rod protein FlgB
MSDSSISDRSMQVLKQALDGLSTRQQVISRNLANIDTPGYQAQSVNFESLLKRMIQGGSELRLDSTHSGHLKVQAAPIGSSSISLRPGGSLRADQNNVDIDVELTEMTETGIQYQALSQAASKKLQLLKTIVMSR